MNVEISIILPVYNEGENLRLLVPEIIGVMRKIEKNFEIIAVNDASDDNTTEVLDELSRQYCFVKRINLSKHSGQSLAAWTGIKEASADAIITMDADLQNDPKDIPRMIDEFVGVDMVCGIRRVRNDSFVKKVSSVIANWIRRKTLKSDIMDSACGFKIFKKECFEKLDFFDGMHRFLPDLFIMKGFPVKQLPIGHRPRKYGKSNYGIGNRLVKTFFDLLMVRRIRKNIKYE